MQIRKIAVSRINPAPYNPRVDLKPGDAEYEKLRRSLDEFGLVEPLVWNRRTGNLVGGHQRFKVLLERGAKSVEVSEVDLSPEREKALNLALNKISGDWDPLKLAELLDELSRVPDFDLGLTGFDAPEVTDLLERMGLRDRTEAFDVEEELAYRGPVVTKPGDVIELGDHLLVCGDCTDATIVRDLMKRMGGKASLFATDPPYLVGYDGTNHPGGKKKGLGTGDRGSGKAGDKKASTSGHLASGRDAARARLRGGKNKDWSESYGVTWDDADANSDLYDRFIATAVAESVLPGAAWYCWHASRRQAMLEAAWVKHGALVHCQIIWVKNRPVLTRTWYAWRHEPCLMGWLQGNKPRRCEASVLSTVWELDTIANGPERPDHPTPKPLEVFEIPMRQHTKPSEIVYEPFAGSGTQLIAAERLGRRCAALEISPRYCDLIVRRWIAAVGEHSAPAALVKRYRRAAEKAPPAAAVHGPATKKNPGGRAIAAARPATKRAEVKA